MTIQRRSMNLTPEIIRNDDKRKNKKNKKASKISLDFEQPFMAIENANDNMLKNKSVEVEKEKILEKEKLLENPTPENIAKNQSTQVIYKKMEFGTIKLDSEEAEDLRKRALEAVINRYKEVESLHDQKVKDWDRWETQWKNKIVSQDGTTKTRVSSPEVWNAVEDWTATIMAANLGVDPPVKFKVKKMLDKSKELKIQKILWQNAKDVGFEEEFERGAREGCKLGTFAFKCPWQLDEKPTLQLVTEEFEENINGAIVKRRKQIIREVIEIEDRVGFKALDLRRLYYRYDKPSWIIERINDNWDTIEKLAKENNVYTNLEKAKKTIVDTTGQPDSEAKSDSETTPLSSLLSIDGDVEIFEGHHIPFYFKKSDPVPEELKGKKVPCIISIANEQEVIRLQPTPYRTVPYLLVPFIPQAGSSLGVGIPEIIEKMYKELNLRKNLSLNANTLGLYCMIAANMKFIKKPQQLQIKPHQVIELTNVPQGANIENILSFVRPPVEFVQVAQQLIGKIEQNIQVATRLKGVSSGEKVAPNPTATEMASIMKEALKSLKLVFRRIDRGIVEEYFERAYIMTILNRQKSWFLEFKPDELQTIRHKMFDGQTMMGQEHLGAFSNSTEEMPMSPMANQENQWIEITPQDIYSNGIEVEALGASHMEDEIVKTHQSLQTLDIIYKYGNEPVVNDEGQSVMLNKYKAGNDMLYSSGKKDIKEWWIAVPPPLPTPPVPMTLAEQPMLPGIKSPNLQNIAPNMANLLGGAAGAGRRQ